MLIMGKGKNTGKPSLGRTLIKEKRQSSGGGKLKNDQWLHTSELQDGYDWARLNLRSVTEQTAIDEFLATAELADTEFTAEKGNVQIVTSRSIPGVFTEEELLEIKKVQSQNQEFIRVPRRPPWDKDTSAEELQKAEKETFLNWRRQLALLQESNDKLLLTPYEKNIDIWRQLWRVIERSDVICQIVDARNPLLYRCDDLDKYVAEVDSKKSLLLIVNKSDFLTEPQRKYWCDYFTSVGIHAIFWSALAESEEASGATGEEQQEEEDKGLSSSSDTEEDGDEVTGESEEIAQKDKEYDKGDEDRLASQFDDSLRVSGATLGEDAVEDGDSKTSGPEGNSMERTVTSTQEQSVTNNQENLTAISATADERQPCCAMNSMKNTTHVYSRSELVELFSSYRKVYAESEKPFVTIGLVGYPNVGKSSTINALLEAKKTSVSATPGKTKHFQTLFLDDEVCLCDCPGLVFPHFVSSKAEMVLGGILPIDELRDCVPPITLLCRRLPRQLLEATYGINIDLPPEGEQQDRPPTAHEMLASYANMRGFMTSHGLPDISRAARYVLKDYVKGRLLYSTPPPNVSQEDFKVFACIPTNLRTKSTAVGKQSLGSGATTRRIDSEFFKKEESSAVFKSPTGFLRPGLELHSHPGVGKPWKKHFNKNKKEKLRRLCKP